MEYNKRQFKKANDKKVLRKIGKQWKVISLALLMAIGGFSVTSQIQTHASNVNNLGVEEVMPRSNQSLQSTSMGKLKSG